jgi:hypothetical protein
MSSVGNFQQPVRRRDRRMPGLSLRMMFIVVTAFAVFLALRSRRTVTERKIAELKAILGEISVTNIDQLAIKHSSSQMEPPSFNGKPPAKKTWVGELFLPRSESYRLCFAGSGIGPTELPNAEKIFQIQSGYRRIELSVEKDAVEKDADVCRFSVLVDEEVQWTREFDGSIPLNWFFDGVCQADETKQQSTDEPLEIIRNMLGRNALRTPASIPLAADEGIVVWIEKR